MHKLFHAETSSVDSEVNFDLFLLFFSIVGTSMFLSSTSVLLVTALTCIWAQEFYEERKTNKRSRAKPVAANIHDGQGKTMNENMFILIPTVFSVQEIQHLVAVFLCEIRLLRKNSAF